MKLFRLILFIGVCQLTGILGAVFTTQAIPTWYSTLIKPSFFPPNSVFGPVWFVLYTLMGISAYLISESKSKNKTEALSYFWVQLILNFSWSLIFFGMKNPQVALAEILVLLTFILLTIAKFYKISKIAGYLLLPYFFWVTFATILNLTIVLLN